MAVLRGPTTRETGDGERVYRIPCCPLDRSRSPLHGQCVQIHLVGLRRSLVRISIRGLPAWRVPWDGVESGFDFELGRTPMAGTNQRKATGSASTTEPRTQAAR